MIRAGLRDAGELLKHKIAAAGRAKRIPIRQRAKDRARAGAAGKVHGAVQGFGVNGRTAAEFDQLRKYIEQQTFEWALPIVRSSQAVQTVLVLRHDEHVLVVLERDRARRRAK